MDKERKRALLLAAATQLGMAIQSSTGVINGTQKEIKETPCPTHYHGEGNFVRELTAEVAQHKVTLQSHERALSDLRTLADEDRVHVDETIHIGAVLSLELFDEVCHYLYLSYGGGFSFEFEGTEYTIMAPESPIVRVVSDKRAGEEVIYSYDGRRSTTIKIVQVY